jgi:hypothetical protein
MMTGEGGVSPDFSIWTMVISMLFKIVIEKMKTAV